MFIYILNLGAYPAHFCSNINDLIATKLIENKVSMVVSLQDEVEQASCCEYKSLLNMVFFRFKNVL